MADRAAGRALSGEFPQRLWTTLRAHLRLGRVSNLPTVWSNCVAGWALADGAFVPSLFVMILAVSLIYVGGMYLNDACDAAHDEARRPERPIPRGEVSQSQAYVFSYVYLALGLLVASGEGWRVAISAAILLGLVIAYDLVHKVFPWSPLLMGGCRAMVYVCVGLAARGGIHLGILSVALWAGALGAYIVGLSFLAREEEPSAMRRYAPLPLLFLPALLFLSRGLSAVRLFWAALAIGWLAYCLALALGPKRSHFHSAVAGLLAGICAVDFLAVTQIGGGSQIAWQSMILAFFAAAYILQKSVPAT